MTTQHALRMSSHSVKSLFARMVTYFVAATMIVTAFLSASSVANAQEVEATAEAVVTDEASTSATVTATSEVTAFANVIPPELLQDMQVTQQDLGAVDATVLPDSPLYFFKELWWDTQEAFTFDPLADAQLKLEHANQSLYEIQVVAQAGVTDASTAADLVGATEQITERLEEVAASAEDLQAVIVVGGEEAATERLLVDIVEHQVYGEKVLEVVKEQIEAVASLADVVDFYKAREQAVEEVVAVLVEAVQESADIAEVIGTVFEERATEGSAFVDLHHLEILEKVEDAAAAFVAEAELPRTEAEAVTAAFETVRDEAVGRFDERLGVLPEEERAKKMVDYIKHLPADETHILAVCDELKGFVLPDDISTRIEEMKDLVVTRVADKIQKFADAPEVRAQFLSNLTDANDFKDLRILDDIADRIVIDDPALKAEIEQHREEGIVLFKERFTDERSGDQAERFRDLSMAMAKKPDPTTMKLMMALETEVRSDPSKSAFLDNMQNMGKTVRAVFEEKARTHGESFLKQMTTSDPRDLAVMRQFSSQFSGPLPPIDFKAEFGEELLGLKGGRGELLLGAPQGFDASFDPFKALEGHQKTLITEHIQNMNDPKVFRAMQERFVTAAPDVVQEMQSFGNFKEMFNQKASFIQDKVLAEEAARVQSELQQQSAAALLGQLSGVTDETTRQQILQQAQTQQAERLETQLKERQDSIKQFSSFNPFCDAACQQTSSQRFERKFEQQTEQLKQNVHVDVTKQFEQFKALEQSGDLEQYRLQFEKQLGAPSTFERGGTFPGRGATEGIFPGRGATEGVFPGLGRPEGFEIPAPGETSDTLKQPVPAVEKMVPAPKPVEEFKDYTYPKTGETGTYPKPEDTTTYPKPSETPTSFDDYFKTYQPKPGETTTYPTPSATDLLYQPTTQPLTTEPLTTQPLTTQPLTTQPLTTEPLTTQPLTTEPITQPTTIQPTPTVTEPTPTYTAPVVTEPTPTYTAPVVTEPMPVYTAPTGDYMMPQSSVWQRLARSLYAFLTFPARAFGL